MCLFFYHVLILGISYWIIYCRYAVLSRGRGRKFIYYLLSELFLKENENWRWVNYLAGMSFFFFSFLIWLLQILPSSHIPVFHVRTVSPTLLLYRKRRKDDWKKLTFFAEMPMAFLPMKLCCYVTSSSCLFLAFTTFGHRTRHWCRFFRHFGIWSSSWRSLHLLCVF